MIYSKFATGVFVPCDSYICYIGEVVSVNKDDAGKLVLDFGFKRKSAKPNVKCEFRVWMAQDLMDEVGIGYEGDLVGREFQIFSAKYIEKRSLKGVDRVPADPEKLENLVGIQPFLGYFGF